MQLSKFIEKLPVEIIWIILSYLDLQNLRKLAKINNLLPKNFQYALLNIIYSNLYVTIPDSSINKHHNASKDIHMSIEAKLRLLEKSHYYKVEGNELNEKIPKSCWQFIRSLSIGCQMDLHNRKRCTTNWKRFMEKRILFDILNKVRQCSLRLDCPYMMLSSIRLNKDSQYSLYLSQLSDFGSLNNISLIDNVWKMQIDMMSDKLVFDFLKVRFLKDLKILKINLPSRINVIDGDNLKSLTLIYLKVSADDSIVIKNFGSLNLPSLSDLHVFASLVNIIDSNLQNLKKVTIKSEKPFDANLVPILTTKTLILSISSPIRDIPASFSKFNKLTDLRVSPSNLLSFSNLCMLLTLKKIDLSKNMILSIPSDFSNLINLEDLNLSYNKIQHTENLPKSLMKLDLSCNNIRTVEYQDFSIMQNLKNIDLLRNKSLKNLQPLVGSINLEYLDVENTSFNSNLVLNDILTSCRNLRHLNIRNTEILKIKYSSLTVDL